jgi:hypothetical protein
MCLIKAPKIARSSADDRDPPILRNPYLDGVDPLIRARQHGLKSLTTYQPPAATASPSALRITR